MPQIQIDDQNDKVIMRLVGDFNDEDENDRLLETFKKLGKQDKKKVIVDLTQVYYLNSRALGVLLSGNAVLNKINGKLVVFGANDYLENIFSITKLNLTLDICKTYEEAEKEIETVK
jgi:anti-anti-sigma factor